jgi:hypothetical protein
MPAAFLILKLRTLDSTIVADLVDGANFNLVNEGWGPNGTQLRQSMLGGRGPYEDVEQTIEIDISGVDAATLIANITKLSQLQDQAFRWSRYGQNVTSVVFEIQLQGSALASSLLAAVLDLSFQMPKNFNDMLMVREVNGATLRIRHRGQLIGADLAATSASSNNPAELTATFSSSAIFASPVKLALTGFNTTTTPTFPASMLIIAPTTNHISIFDASSFVGAPGTPGTFTSFNDATKKPYNGTNVARFTGSTINPQTTGGLADLNFTNARRVQVLAVVRNTDGFSTFPATSFQLRANLNSDSGVVSTRYKTILPSATVAPVIVNLGMVVLSSPTIGVSLTAIASSASNAHLDISHIVLVNVEDERSRVIPIDSKAASNLTSGAFTLTVDDRILSAESPTVQLVAGSTSNNIGYHADAMLMTSGTTLVATWLATGGFAADRWRFTNTSDAIVANTITATRHTAYLTPQ